MAKSLEERVTELEKKVLELSRRKKVKANKNLIIGDTFELLDLEWKILDITDAGYICLAECLENSVQFDSSCSNWSTSNLRNYLNVDFYKKLAEEVGAENILEFERNLLSLDGQTEYGICKDKVSLITMDEYRHYRKLIPNMDYWWWTCTPWSTPCNDYKASAAVVSPSGDFNLIICNFSNGVRPFCIFSSSIFESEE